MCHPQSINPTKKILCSVDMRSTQFGDDPFSAFPIEVKCWKPWRSALQAWNWKVVPHSPLLEMHFLQGPDMPQETPFLGSLFGRSAVRNLSAAMSVWRQHRPPPISPFMDPFHCTLLTNIGAAIQDIPMVWNFHPSPPPIDKRGKVRVASGNPRV